VPRVPDTRPDILLSDKKLRSGRNLNVLKGPQRGISTALSSKKAPETSRRPMEILKGRRTRLVGARNTMAVGGGSSSESRTQMPIGSRCFPLEKVGFIGVVVAFAFGQTDSLFELMKEHELMIDW